MTSRTLRTVLTAVAVGTLVGWAIPPAFGADDLDKIRSKPVLGQMSSQYLVPVQSPGESFARQIGFDKATRDILLNGPVLWRTRIGEYALPTTCHVPPATGGTDVGTEACPFRSLWATEINGGTIPTGALGDVVGPASSTNSDIACFDGTTGKLLKDCGYSGSDFSPDFSDSAGLAGLLSDETGFSTGALSVFSINPTLDGATLTGVLTAGAGEDLIANVPTGQAHYWRINNAPVLGLDASHIGPTNAGGLNIGRAGVGWGSIFIDSASTANTLELTRPTIGSNIQVAWPAAAGTLALTSDLSAYQPLDSDLTSWAGVTRASGFDTFAATPSSANLISLVTDETGTGALVFANTPTLVTPVIGVATGTSLALTGGATLPFTSSRDNNSVVTAISRRANITTSAVPQGAVDYFGFYDSSSVQRDAAYAGAELTARTAGTVTGEYVVATNNATASTVTRRHRTTATAFHPETAGNLDLGTVTKGWASLFLDEAGAGTQTAQIITPTLSADIVITTPAATGTLATLAGTETLTNKTLTAPAIASIVNTGTLTLPTATSTLVGTVAEVNLTAQGSNIGITTLYAVPSDGFYRVNLSVNVTREATSSSSTPLLGVAYTDADSGVSGAIAAQVAQITSNALGDHADGIGVFYADGGTDIVYSGGFYASSGATSMQYSLRIRLERLN